MLTARSLVAAATVLCNPLLFCFTPQPLLGLCRGKHGEAHSDIAGHILQPLNLGVAEAPSRRGATENLDLLQLKGELAGRMIVLFR